MTQHRTGNNRNSRPRRAERSRSPPPRRHRPRSPAVGHEQSSHRSPSPGRSTNHQRQQSPSRTSRRERTTNNDHRHTNTVHDSRHSTQGDWNRDNTDRNRTADGGDRSSNVASTSHAPDRRNATQSGSRNDGSREEPRRSSKHQRSQQHAQHRHHSFQQQPRGHGNHSRNKHNNHKSGFAENGRDHNSDPARDRPQDQSARDRDRRPRRPDYQPLKSRPLSPATIASVAGRQTPLPLPDLESTTQESRRHPQSASLNDNQDDVVVGGRTETSTSVRPMRRPAREQTSRSPASRSSSRSRSRSRSGESATRSSRSPAPPQPPAPPRSSKYSQQGQRLLDTGDEVQRDQIERDKDRKTRSRSSASDASSPDRPKPPKKPRRFLEENNTKNTRIWDRDTRNDHARRGYSVGNVSEGRNPAGQEENQLRNTRRHVSPVRTESQRRTGSRRRPSRSPSPSRTTRPTNPRDYSTKQRSVSVNSGHSRASSHQGGRERPSSKTQNNADHESESPPPPQLPQPPIGRNLRSHSRTPSEESPRSRSSSLPPHRRPEAARSESPLPPERPRPPNRGKDNYERSAHQQLPRGPRNNNHGTNYNGAGGGRRRENRHFEQRSSYRSESGTGANSYNQDYYAPPPPPPPPTRSTQDESGRVPKETPLKASLEQMQEERPSAPLSSVGPKFRPIGQQRQSVLASFATTSKTSAANSTNLGSAAGVKRFFPGDDEDIDGQPIMIPPPKPLANLPLPVTQSDNLQERSAGRRSRSRSRSSRSLSRSRSRSRSPQQVNRRNKGRWNSNSQSRGWARGSRDFDRERDRGRNRDDRDRTKKTNRRERSPRSASASPSRSKYESDRKNSTGWGAPPSAKTWRSHQHDPSGSRNLQVDEQRDTSRRDRRVFDESRPTSPRMQGTPPDGSASRARNVSDAAPVALQNEVAATAVATVPAAPPAPREAYQRLSQVGEGTYGKVYKAQDLEGGLIVAMKRIRMEGERDGFPITALREIKLLQKLRHPNIVNLIEMVVSHGSVYMILEYMDHDLSGILLHPKINLTLSNIKSLMWQLLSGLQYMHEHSVLHRDLKGSNLLLNKSGQLKIADFGLARIYERGKEIGREGKGRGRDYTNRVITLWYKPPELLLGATVYGEEVDVWGAGAIFLELFTKKPIFQGTDEIDQLHKTYKILGTPTSNNWPNVTTLPWFELVKPKGILPSKLRDLFFGPDLAVQNEGAMTLVEWLLKMDPNQRPSAKDALTCDYFVNELPIMEPPIEQLANVAGDWHELDNKIVRKGK